MVKLIISNISYTCKDAATAAKIVDLLQANCTKVDYIYEGSVADLHDDSACFHYSEPVKFTIAEFEGDLYESHKVAKVVVDELMAIKAEAEFTAE